MYDMALIKRPTDDIDLAVGEPYVLQAALPHFVFDVRATESQRYPVFGGEPNLVRELENLHPGYHVVIASGAKQAVAATFYAYRHRLHQACHAPPYWPSFPTLADHTGLRFNCCGEEALTIVTAPSNPRGIWNNGKYVAWDAAYAHPVYGWKPQYEIGLTYDVKIGSASKLFGLSGARVGWLLTKDQEIADLAAAYIETTTSGPSVAGQQLVAKAFAYSPQMEFEYATAREMILENADTFNRTLGPIVAQSEGVPAYNLGMFAWFQVKPDYRPQFEEALTSAGVRLIPGNAFGEAEPGWYRMSLGNLPKVTTQALERLQQEIEKRSP